MRLVLPASAPMSAAFAASRATTAMSLPALPTVATVAGGYRVAAATGGAAIAAHLAGVLIVRALPDSKRPVMLEPSGYAVYKIIGLAFVLIQVAIGAAWYFPALAGAAISGPACLSVSGGVRFLAAIVFGSLVFWDLPCALFIPRIRKPDMIGHHAVLALTAWVLMTYVPVTYGFFYLGAQELSSVPVCIWNLYTAADQAASRPPLSFSRRVTPKKLERLATGRDLSQLVAALAFIVMRGVEFTRITLTRLAPDVLAVLPTPAAAGSRVAMRAAFGLALGFNALQLYWLWQIVSTMVKKIFFGGDGVPDRDRND